MTDIDLEVDRCPYCNSKLRWWWNNPENGALCTRKCEGMASTLFVSREMINEEKRKHKEGIV